jgi:hypothetical protein
MNFLSLSVSGLLVLLSAAFAVLLVVAILNNLAVGRRYRQDIRKQLSRLRLSRMLALHRIDPETYLHTQAMLDVKNQIRRCSSCAETQRCDKILAEDNDTDTKFCNNDDKLQELKNKLGSAA